MRRRCNHNPSEEVKPPAAWLRAEHRRSAHAIRCTTDFSSSRRNARGTLASYSSLGDERYLPRGRPEHPVPAHQDEPCEHRCDAAGRIRTRALFSDLRRFHVKPAHSPQEVHHTCPFSPAVHIVTFGFFVLPNARQLDQHLPKQMYLPHSFISAQRLPSHRTRPYSTADLQYPHSSGVRLVLTCYSTRRVYLRQGESHQCSSGNLK